MPPESKEPFYGYEQAFYSSEQMESANRTLTYQPGKIDPMGMMGKIFACLGAILIVIGILIASLLTQFSSAGSGFSFATTAGAWGTGLVFLLLGLIMLMFFRNLASANVVDHYFTAFVNQDYATAFQYLDPNITTRQGEWATESWFIQRAQAYDERGKITNYALKGFHLNPRRATYTIKVTRGEGSYLVHLALAKTGDTWKIIGYSLL